MGRDFGELGGGFGELSLIVVFEGLDERLLGWIGMVVWWGWMGWWLGGVGWVGGLVGLDGLVAWWGWLGVWWV